MLPESLPTLNNPNSPKEYKNSLLSLLSPISLNRSLERTLTNDEINDMQERVREHLVHTLNVELR